MLNKIFGYLEVIVTGRAVERFINICKSNNINIWYIRCNKNKDKNIFEYSFNISLKDFFRIRPIVRKTHIKVKVTKRAGLNFILGRYRNRKMFAIGIIIAYIFINSMSNYVWKIQVEGNYSYSEDEIISFLLIDDIKYGDKINNINCDEIERKLRVNYDEIKWASVEIKGTCVILHVRENVDDFVVKNEENPYDLITDKSGTIVSIITRAGTPLVKTGDSVEAGQILVSGKVDTNDDYGTYISSKYVNADSDIYIRYETMYENVISLDYDRKIYTDNEDYTYIFGYNNKYIDINLIDKKYKNYETINYVHQLVINDYFSLPFYYNKRIEKEYYVEAARYTEIQALELANERLNSFLTKMIEKGIQIIENNVKIEIVEDLCKSKGSLVLIAKTGIPQSININQETTDEHN